MCLNTIESLAELQRCFQAAILSADPVIPPFIAAATPEAAEIRFRIYREAYRLRLTEALAADYPALQALLGDDGFTDLAYAYAESRPSRHYSIRWAGAQLAEFLRHRPDLADLAVFEWVLSEAFDAVNATPLNVAALSAIPVEQWPDLRLSFHPSLRPIVLYHNATDVWRAATAAERTLPALEAEKEPRNWLVWRRDLAVYYRPLDDGEAWALDAARHGAAFADWCEGLSLCLDGAKDAASMAASLLRRWVDDGLIVGTAR